MCLDSSSATITYWSWFILFRINWFVRWLGIFSFPRSVTGPWAIAGTVISSFDWSPVIHWTKHSRGAHWAFTKSALGIISRTFSCCNGFSWAIAIATSPSNVQNMWSFDIRPLASRLRSLWKSFLFNVMLKWQLWEVYWWQSHKKQFFLTCRSIVR